MSWEVGKEKIANILTIKEENTLNLWECFIASAMTIHRRRCPRLLRGRELGIQKFGVTQST